MKIKLAAVFSAAVLMSTSVYADGKPLGKYTLEPGKKQTLTVKASTETQIGFDTELEIKQLMECKHYCIKMKQDGTDNEFSSATGGSIKLTPKDGKIEVVFENMEAFAIPITVYQK